MLTRITVALVLFIAVKCCYGQLPVLPFAPMISASTTPSSFMPSLAEAWEFTTLATNAVALSWTGLIQKIVVTNGATATQPSNTTFGLGFFGKQVLTNFTPLPIGSNYTLSVFVRYVGVGNGGLNVNDSLVGTNTLNTGSSWYLNLIDANSSTLNFGVQKINNTTINFNNPVHVPMDRAWDFVYSVSNNANGGNGTALLWTNGIFVGSISSDSSSPQMSFIGAGPAGLVNINGVGQSNYIQGFYIQTNFVGTTANASNVHYYRTNVFTPGATP